MLDENLRDKNLARRLGHAFAKREGVRHGPRKLYLAQAGNASRAILWTVRQGGGREGGKMRFVNSLSSRQPSPRARARVTER